MRLKMFTGIIEETGTVRNISLSGSSGRIQVGASVVLEGTKVGDSIAVNGVCLTVTSIDGRSFTADVMAETLRRSNLGQLRGGDLVNLERAMPAEGRFGGHIVSGHIDGTGTIAGMEKEGNATWVRIRTAAALLALIVEKGSIAIDGISLTVAQVGAEDFAVSIIPHTSANTTLLRKRIGDTVNLENDIVGKYVQRLVGQAQPQPQQQPHRSRITEEFLRENGF
jgi:riboflavin synthase